MDKEQAATHERPRLRQASATASRAAAASLTSAASHRPSGPASKCTLASHLQRSEPATPRYSTAAARRKPLAPTNHRAFEEPASAEPRSALKNPKTPAMAMAGGANGNGNARVSNGAAAGRRVSFKAPSVGPGRLCSTRHRMPFNS